MTDDEIEQQRVAGEITLVLEHGTPEERESLLSVIARLHGQARADQLRAEYCDRPAGLPRCAKCKWHHEPEDICPTPCDNEGEEWKP